MNWSSSSKVIIQGITDERAAFCAVRMKAYGTKIVAGISPGNGGTNIEGIPVFDLVEQVDTAAIDISAVFVSSYEVLDAVVEAISAGIRKIVIFTPRVPPLDTIKIIELARTTDTLVLGPGSHGVLIPQKFWLGDLQPKFYRPGTVGIITSSRHLCNEVAVELERVDLGQSIVISLGNDRPIGSSLSQWLAILNEDPKTEYIVSIGQRIDEMTEILNYSKTHGYDKPVIVYLAGLKAPQEKFYRDATTIISNHLSASIPAVNRDGQVVKKLEKIGIKIARKPSQISELIKTIASTIVKE